MKTKTLAILLGLFAISIAFAQDPPAAVKRPSVPGASTLNSPTSQIAAWYRYSVYVEERVTLLEKKVADLLAQPPPPNQSAELLQRVMSVDANTTTLVARTDNAPTTNAILAKLVAIEAKLLAVLTGPSAPVITPGTHDANAGSNLTFSATATGEPAPTWQWKKNGAVLDGSTNATLVLLALTENDSAFYTAVATNSEGSAESTVKLTVVP